MAWHMTGQWLSSCSCRQICPCSLGPAQPDQGWCSAAIALAVRDGAADGLSLSGTNAVVAFELPGDFLGGVDVARLYLDEAASPEQRQALEAIVRGRKGGVWEAIGAGIKEWLPTRVARIEIRTEEPVGVSVEGAGEITLQRITTEDGRQTALTNAPVPAAFGIATIELARAEGSRWTDPELRPWQSLGSGDLAAFDWRT